MIQIKKHFIKNTETGKKCRVWYSLGNLVSQPNRKCITIYAKSYSDSLAGIIDFINDSDSMTDYFEKDRARIFEDEQPELYALCLQYAI